MVHDTDARARDVALLRRAARGDQSAWDALVEEYSSLLWSIARAHRLEAGDAADVVQTVWLRLLENLERISDPARLPGWLATTTRRECLRVLGKRRRELPVLTYDTLDAADPEARAVDERLLLAETEALLWTAFQRLGERCQKVLRVLMATPPPSYDAVSAALDMPVGSIGPTRGRCLDQLRQIAKSVGLIDVDQPAGA